MELVTVTFDRVFDIVRSAQRNRIPCVEFGFESGGLKKYGVAVPGKPEVVAGMTVAAVLRSQGNWQTLFGWVNLSTGEIVCRSWANEVGWLGLAFIAATWSYFSHLKSPALAAVATVAALLSAATFAVGAWRAARARALLEHVWHTRSNLPVNPQPPAAARLP